MLQVPDVKLLRQIRREGMPSGGRTQHGPQTKAEWQAKYDDVLLQLPNERRSQPGAMHGGACDHSRGIRDVDPLVCLRGLGFSQ